MKFSTHRIAPLFILSSVIALTGSTVHSAYGQTPTPSPSTSKQDKTAASSAPQQQATTERERRARAYSKLLEGERHLLELRTAGSAETLRLARQAFQEAATLDPTLAEAHTALAEISFYYPPQDFDAAAREGAAAVRIDPNNFGGHKILSRLYAIRSGLREGNLNRSFVDLAIKELGDFFPAAREANLIKATVVKEVNATYSAQPLSDRYRPSSQTGWPRIFLAGDWTATGWPATMEGAVRSGYKAAEAVAKATGDSHVFLKPDLPATGLMRMFK